MARRTQPRGAVSKLSEVGGMGCVIAFLWACWPPLALLGVGLALIVIGDALDG